MIDIDKLISEKVVIVILGPTASGKTDLSLELSAHLPSEIISADSRQIYKYMDIGTAKPNQTELSKAKHHFINILNPDQDYNAGQFGNDARKIIEELYLKSKIPIVVGGSGLYIKSLCEGLFRDGEEDDREKQSEIRLKLASRLENEGREKLYEELQLIDPVSAQKYSDLNPRRILRALEHYYLYNQTITESQKINNIYIDLNPIYFGINFERESLYQRINLRTEFMWENGLLDETKRLLFSGYSSNLNSLNTVGYKETIDYINGNSTETHAIDLIKQNTRRYAKRQLTWFRNQNDVSWIPAETQKKIDLILNKINNENRK